MLVVQAIRVFCRLVFGERAVFIPVSLDQVDAPPLNKVPDKALAVFLVVEVDGSEFRIDQGQQPSERVFVPGVRRGCQQDQPTRGIACKALEQVETLLLPLVRADAGVCFIDNNEIRTGPGEPIPAFLGFDVVKADHREGIGIEKGLRQWEIALQTRRSTGGDGNGIDPEAILQFCDPLVHEVRRAENRKRIDLSAIHQLAEDQTRFDGLADADVVGNQQPRHLKP
ncbi:hypothetical protein D3C77_398530 [compost metagenome]